MKSSHTHNISDKNNLELDFSNTADITVIIFCDTQKNWLGRPALSLKPIGEKNSLEILLQQLQAFQQPVFVLYDHQNATTEIMAIVKCYQAQAIFSPPEQSEAIRIKNALASFKHNTPFFVRLRSENPILGQELLIEFLNNQSKSLPTELPFFLYPFGYPTGINLEFFNSSFLESALHFPNTNRLREIADIIELSTNKDATSIKPTSEPVLAHKTFHIKKLLPKPELAHPEIRWTLGTAEDFSLLSNFLTAYSPSLSLKELLDAWNNRHLALANAPKLLNIEPSNYCNLKCIMCPRDKMTRPQGKMSMELFSSILTQAAEMGIEQIVLTGYGEPFLHPDIFQMLKLLRQSGLQSRMYTNAQLLCPDYIDKLSSNPPCHLTISLDGINPQTYEKIRRNGNFHKVMDNLNYLLESRKSWALPMKISLRITQMPETSSDIDHYLQFWQERIEEIELVPMHNWGGQVDGYRHMPDQSLRFPCKELWRTMAIFWDGRVTICCAAFDDHLIVGDLKKESLQNIWTGKGYTALRKLHATNKADQIELCRSCDVWQTYG